MSSDEGARSEDWTWLPDLANRRVGGAVVAVSDEFFADRENLIKPEPPVHRPHTFTPKGQEYDGWETRRRRGGPDDHDWAIVRLGIPGRVRAVVVDTAFFAGNYPPHVSIEGCGVEGYPDGTELVDADWSVVVPRRAIRGDTRNVVPVDSPWRYTHLRLRIYPDGGVARLRVHGEAIYDPRWLADVPVDLAALVTGGRVVGCSDRFFAPPDNMLLPGPPLVMSDGWETARRRDGGHDWAVIRLAAPVVPRVLEIDTTHFKGNAPDHVTVTGIDGRYPVAERDAPWLPVLPSVPLRPDTPHRFRVTGDHVLTHLRLHVYPDGGIGRFRVYGHIPDEGRHELASRWFAALPPSHATRLLIDDLGLDEHHAQRLVAARSTDTRLPTEITPLLGW